MTQTAKVPWQVSFASEAEKWKYFTSVCCGNEKMAKVLERIVYIASWEAKNQGLGKSCKVVKFTRSHKAVMEGFNFPITEKTYIQYCKQFNEWNYLTSSRYARETEVNFEAIRTAFVTPPARPPRKKHKSCKKISESCTTTFQHEDEERDRIIGELNQKVVTLQEKVEELQLKVVTLQEKVSSVTTLQHDLDQLLKRVDSLKNAPTMIYYDSLSFTNESSGVTACADDTPTPTVENGNEPHEEMQPTTTGVMHATGHLGNHPVPHADVCASSDRMPDASTLQPAQRATRRDQGAESSTREHEQTQSDSVSAHSAQHEQQGGEPELAASEGLYESPPPASYSPRSQTKPEKGKGKAGRGKEPARPALPRDPLADAPELVKVIILEWQQASGDKVVSPTAMKHAETLSQYKPVPGEIAGCVAWNYDHDMNETYKRRPQYLGDVVNSFAGYRRSLSKAASAKPASSSGTVASKPPRSESEKAALEEKKRQIIARMEEQLRAQGPAQMPVRTVPPIPKEVLYGHR